MQCGSIYDRLALPCDRYYNALVERSGKNIGGYFGERIDIQDVLRQIDRAIAEKNWVRDVVPLTVDDAGRKIDFLFYRRALPEPRHHIYLSTGIHGDEPAGPLALLQFLELDRWPAGAAIWLCPCLNVTGFPLNRRENFQGIDLNRDYRHLASAEIRAHVDWLQRQPRFDISICLHEDWEAQGFYLYELNPDQKPSFAPKIIDAVAKVCPIDGSPSIEGRPAQHGVIRPQLNPEDRPQWPEALYLITNKTRLSYTMEAPSDFPLPMRVAALTAAMRAVLESF